MRSSHPITRAIAVLAVAVLAACGNGGSADDDSGGPASDPPSTAGTQPPTEAPPAAEEDAEEPAVDSPTALVAASGWEVVDPAEVGLDGAVLDAIAADAEDAGSHCLVVVRDGRIAGEWSWADPGTAEAQEVFSVTKSFTATITGIVIDDGDGGLGLDETAASWIEEWVGTPSEEVTVRHLLSNDSGRFWSFASDYTGLVGSGDTTAYAVELDQEHPPGEVWAYNNAAIQTLEEVLTAATGQELPDLLDERLLAPLGMDDSSLSTDGAGNGLAFMGLQSTCRDLARFGLMALDGGRWGDDQVVPAEWIEASTGTPSQDLNAAYGFLWWLNQRGPQASAVSPTGAEEVEATTDGQLVPGAPEDLVWALGLGDQVVQVHPSTGTVVVRLGPVSLAGGFGPGQTARVVTEAVVP